jgi:hypothetical protein
MKRVLILILPILIFPILILLMTTVAVAHDKKPKIKPGPYVFTSKASAQTVKALIVYESLRDGYALDSDGPLQFRFTRSAQMPLYGAIFMASSACPGMTTKQVWSYTLAEVNGMTKVTVQPAWDYPDDYCKTQTNPVPWSKPEELLAFQAMLDKAPVAVAQASKPTAAAATSTPASVAVPTPAGNQAAGLPTIQPATQPPAVVPDDAAMRAKQHQACLELAKDNPTITCK